MRRATTRSLLPGALAAAATMIPTFRADAAEPQRPVPPGEIALRLDKLGVVGSVLYVAAHPDDENTALLAYLAQGRLVRTAYLSLTRGDGGQNLIGAEQGAALGVIRTQELLAARRIDGAEQLFSRARDFGFSKSAAEAARIWGEDEILADTVWAIRRFRPDVIINRFGMAPGDGNHGHHTASARLALKAFRAAADPTYRPEQLAHVRPWQARRIFWNRSSFGAPPPAPVVRDGGARAGGPPSWALDVGGFQPLLGLSFGEIAARSRSMHKSQGFGASPRRGSVVERFELLDGDAPPEGGDILAGIDLSWRRVPGSAKLAERLAAARRAFTPAAPERAVTALVQADEALDALPADALDESWRVHTRRELRELIAACAGLWLEAFTGDAATIPGGTLKVTATAVVRTPVKVTLREVRIPGARGPALERELARGQVEEVARTVSIPDDRAPTTPYWLERPGTEGLFDVADQTLRGLPERPPVLDATFTVNVAGRALTFSRPVDHKWNDPVEGERHRPLAIVPPLTIEPATRTLIFTGARPRPLAVTVQPGAQVAGGARGRLRIEAPAGFRVDPAEVPFALDGAAPFTTTVQVRREAAGKGAPGAAPGTLRLVAEIADGPGKGAHALSLAVIEHRHIPRQVVPSAATVTLIPMALARGGDRVGYVPGAGDDVAQSLERVGYKVETLDDAAIAAGELDRFDAIVLGVRAHNTNPRLSALHGQLMRFVAAGGTLLVQYNTQNRISAAPERIGPHPFAISRERVTDETAAVTFLDPAAAVLRAPNRITPADFDGWIQERGLYFAGTWDPAYQAILSMNDPGEPARKGGVLVGNHGRGRFVYTGLAFFRQLPAGVPGAYRLFANLIARRGAR